jgi:predicted nucleotidyltransferase
MLLENTLPERHHTAVIIDDIKAAALPACKAYGVRRLDAFGSVARGTSSPSSDVDLLVEFTDPDRTPARRFFGLLHQLETTRGCEVDLLTINSLRNPYFKSRILREKVAVYEG